MIGSDACVLPARRSAGRGRSHPPGPGHVWYAERPHQHGTAPLRRDGRDQPHLRGRRQQGTGSLWFYEVHGLVSCGAWRMEQRVKQNKQMN